MLKRVFILFGEQCRHSTYGGVEEFFDIVSTLNLFQQHIELYCIEDIITQQNRSIKPMYNGAITKMNVVCQKGSWRETKSRNSHELSRMFI
jgi:hypothetical protein